MLHFLHMHHHSFCSVFTTLPQPFTENEEDNWNSSHHNSNNAECLIRPPARQPHDHLDDHQGDDTGTCKPEACCGCQCRECAARWVSVEKIRDERYKNGHVTPDIHPSGNDGNGRVESRRSGVSDPKEGYNEQDAADDGWDEPVLDALHQYIGVLGALVEFPEDELVDEDAHACCEQGADYCDIESETNLIHGEVVGHIENHRDRDKEGEQDTKVEA